MGNKDPKLHELDRGRPASLPSARWPEKPRRRACRSDSSELHRRRVVNYSVHSITNTAPPRSPIYALPNPRTATHTHIHTHSTQHNSMDRLSRMLAAAQGMGGMGGGPAQDTNLIDNSETVYISSLALLKMLRHGRAGVPMEVMGLMLGEFVDDYTVRVVDVFAMPQSGTGVSVEAVDPVFQTKMMDMLRQTGRYEVISPQNAISC